MRTSSLSRRTWIQACSATAITGFHSLFAGEKDQPGNSVTDIGERRELFVDGALVERMQGCRWVQHPPRDEGIVLRFDQPWEGLFCAYATVIRDGYRYRLYYRGRPQAGADGDEGEVTCYAESLDGRHWVKPPLELYPYRNHRRTNIVLAHAAPVTHNFCPMLDTRPGVESNQRYKAIGGTIRSGLMAYASADGLHWQPMQKEPVLSKQMVPFKYMFDSQNLAFWSAFEQRYVCYFRVFHKGVRSIARSTSDDFLHWSRPVLMEYRHRGKEAPREHLYTNQTHPYFRAPHIYISIAARFIPGRQVLSDEEARAIGVHPRYFKDTSDAVLMSTRGTSWYERTFLSSFIRPGIGARNWVSRTNYPALNVVQTGPNEMSVYVNQDYAQPTAHLRRYSMRLDGFASLQADATGGTIVTRPIRFQGDRLWLNFSTSAAGEIRVGLLDGASGQPIAGYAVEDCQPVIGNEIERAVRWKGGPAVSQVAGRPIRLQFALRDADLFAYRFGKSEAASSERAGS